HEISDSEGALPMFVATTLPSRSEMAMRFADLQEFSMGGTGLEPVPSSLSTWSSRSRRFAQVRSERILERIWSSTERQSEPERTPNLAILATRDAGDRFVRARARA